MVSCCTHDCVFLFNVVEGKFIFKVCFEASFRIELVAVFVLQTDQLHVCVVCQTLKQLF